MFFPELLNLKYRLQPYISADPEILTLLLMLIQDTQDQWQFV